MSVNFYKKPQIKSFSTHSKIEHSVLFSQYLKSFISNSATKRVKAMERWAWHIIPFGLINRFIE